MTQFYWANPRWRPRSHEHDPASPKAQDDVRRVQLAVTISMPSPRRPLYPRAPRSEAEATPRPSTSSDPLKNDHNHENHNADFNSAHDDEPVPDCCIGTIVVSYRPDPNDSSNAPTQTTSTPNAAASTTT